jgi:hypothetical protein
MTRCAYCGEHATLEIPAIPGLVCITHALEFWSGLLTYVKDQAQPTEQLVEPPCVCGMCQESAAHEAALSPVSSAFSKMWRDLPIQ